MAKPPVKSDDKKTNYDSATSVESDDDPDADDANDEDSDSDPIEREKEWQKRLRRITRHHNFSRFKGTRYSQSGDLGRRFSQLAGAHEHARKRRSKIFGSESSEIFRDPDFPDLDEEEESMLGRGKKCCKKLTWSNLKSKVKQVWDDAENLSSSDSEHAKSGHWDHWKAYYCTRNISKYKKFSRPYFAWAMIIIIGQCSGTDLIEYCLANGGGVFLIVVFMTYIGIGYPLLVLETMMGQYSGKKPLQLFRYLSPALSGIGPAIYFRTVNSAIYSLAFGVYSLNYIDDLYFCRMNTNELLWAFFQTELNFPKFELGIFTRGFFILSLSYIVLFIFFILTIVMSSLHTNLIGKGYRLGVILLFVISAWYTYTGYSRAKDGGGHSISFVPLRATFGFDWMKFFDGKTWMDALLFVFNSLGLGTLAHPYLGSQLFFHYRTARDSVFLVLLAFLWNVLGAIGVLVWLGYVCVSETQMRNALNQLGGPYGVFVTYVMKHNQSNQTNQLEADILFLVGFFYTIFGVGALLAVICYIQMLTNSSIPERASARVKLIILVSYCVFFALIVPAFILQDEGLRHLVYMDYYFVRSWSGYFILGCFYWAVAYGHNFSKIGYDFRNIHHFRILPPASTNSRVPKLVRLPGLIIIIMAMIYSIAHIQTPLAGSTEWGGGKFGLVISCIPMLCVVVVGIIVLISFEGPKRLRAFRPHRDWFKNHFHNRRCFNEIPADYQQKKKGEKSKDDLKPMTHSERDALKLAGISVPSV